MLKYRNPDKQLAYMKFLNRENNFRHHYYSEELRQYKMLQAGEPDAAAESHKMMTAETTGHLSDNPVRNMKYLFVANITLATRFAIEGGLDSETAYNISDMYIQQMDLCNSVEEVLKIHYEMFSYFTAQMAKLRKRNVISKSIQKCIDYIDLNLHTKIKLENLSAQTQLSPNYLSALFKKEVGVTVTEYILKRRIDTAKNMLLYSEFSATEISEILSFSSQSHFIKVFRKVTGMTPAEYQKIYLLKGLSAAD